MSEVSDDPNKQLSADEIQAMFAAANGGDAPAEEPAPEPEPEIEAAPEPEAVPEHQASGSD